MSRKYQRYTKEFKLEAVRLAEEADKPVTEIVRSEIGVRSCNATYNSNPLNLSCLE